MDLRIKELEAVFDVDGMRIPAVLCRPERDAVRWCLLIVPGSFYNDLDGNYLKKDGNPFEARPHLYADLARHLAARGIAALRYARAGCTILDESQAGAHRLFSERTVVAAQACRKLRELVPEAKAHAIAGHSEGSVVASLVPGRQSSAEVDACVCLSGPGYRFFDVMIRQTEARVQEGMASFGHFKFPFELYRKSIELVRAGEPVPDHIKAALPPFGIHAAPEIGKQYLRDYDAVDPARAIAEVSCPVLIAQGGKDTSVTPDNAQVLFDARAGCKSGTMKAYFPDLQHFYKPVPPGMSDEEAFALETESDSRVAEQIAAWLRALS